MLGTADANCLFHVDSDPVCNLVPFLHLCHPSVLLCCSDCPLAVDGSLFIHGCKRSGLSLLALVGLSKVSLAFLSQTVLFNVDELLALGAETLRDGFLLSLVTHDVHAAMVRNCLEKVRFSTSA